MSFVDDTVWLPLIEMAREKRLTLLQTSIFGDQPEFVGNLKNLQDAIAAADASPFDLDISSKLDQSSMFVRSYGASARLVVIESLLLELPFSLPRDNAIAGLMEGKPHLRQETVRTGVWSRVVRRIFQDRCDDGLNMAVWLVMTESADRKLWEAAVNLIGVITLRVLAFDLRPGLIKTRDKATGELYEALDYELKRLFHVDRA
jgi:hypothetical protein